ncbi:DUF397 domain-containing protein [Streptomyces uncialis]|uniref:DUF397 domain-containing protein n=1 Tax=Streptomyces uncialis TaxID=1048205 RepID=UPI00093D3B19|nr:DUF397 domain-containing protein [Streptomyces uncialis]
MKNARLTLLATDLPGAAWRKSSASAGEGNCVEVADCAAIQGGCVAVRDSKDPEGPVLVFRNATFSAFVADIDGIRR